MLPALAFDLLNESEGIEISDIQSDDRSNIFTIVIADGSVFEIECREKIERDI